MTDPAVIRSDVVLGRYRIVRRLAAGGMGVVYLARIEGAEGFARPAVIKRMLPALMHDEELVRLFVREAQILSRIRHPGVVSVLDFASERDSYLMALEYVHGFHVGHWLKFLRTEDRPFPPELALHVVAQVLDALDYVHHLKDEDGEPLNIVHRDISPSNILIDVEGHVRLLDFGVARMTGEATHAKDGEVSLKGKFPYLAPELLSQSNPSPASDVYAAGVVLHELLSGQNEFKRQDATETLRRVLLHELSSIEEVRSDVPAGIDRVLRRATAREPRNRYERGKEFAEDLRALLGQRSEADLRQRLVETAAADFDGPLPERLGLEPLSELEKAWRDPGSGREMSWPPIDETDSFRIERVSDLPTEAAVLDEHGNVQPSTSRRGRRRTPWAMIGLGILAAAALTVGVIALIQGRGPGEPSEVLVIERETIRERAAPAPTADAGASAEAAATPAIADDGSVTADEPEAPPARPASRSPRPADPAANLTRHFLARQPALRQCFRQHTTSLEGQPQISFRFTVDRRGDVDRVELLDPAVAGTPLGGCLLSVARGTRFGPQRAPVTFRIPITVRSLN